MPEFVIDASAFVNHLMGAGFAGVFAHGVLDGFYAPGHFGLEVVSAARRLERRGIINGGGVDALVDASLSEAIVHVDMSASVTDIARLRHDFTPFDAAYVLLAQRLSLPLVTSDGRLARAARGHCDVRLV